MLEMLELDGQKKGSMERVATRLFRGGRVTTLDWTLNASPQLAARNSQKRCRRCLKP